VRRAAERRLLIRPLRDIRLSRFSMVLLAILSGLATAVIITTGSGRTPAEMAALAALRQRPATVQASAPAAAPAATTPPAGGSGSAGDAGSSDGAGAGDASDSSSSDSSDSSDSGAESTADDSSSDTQAQTGDDSDSGDDDTGTTPAATDKTKSSTLPKVGHVFEIALSTGSYAAAFGHGSAAPYLRSLAAKGTLLSGYASLGRGELADDLAMVSGQAPNADTSAGCTKYVEFPQKVVANSHGMVPGRGCVYPETALTIGDQVSAKGHEWKAYVADMGTATCTHPNSDAVDDAALPGTDPGYDTHHNPFIYFHSLLDLGDCSSDDQDLSHLTAALARTSKTATFSFIAPDACADAAVTAATPPDATDPASPTSSTTTSPSSATTPAASTAPAASTTTAASTTAGSTTTSASATPSSTTTSTTTTTGAPAAPAAPAGCPAGQPVGIAAENAFLKLWVPRILASPAYRADGVLIVAFAGDGHTHAARTGALVLSRYATKGKVIHTAYTPYSLLHSVEDILGDTGLAHATSAASFAQAVLHQKQ
jgi:hypothetical protein